MTEASVVTVENVYKLFWRTILMKKLSLFLIAGVFSLNAFAADELSPEDAAKIVEQYKELDTNADGVLSADEVAGNPVGEAFADVDVDADGSVNEEEFIAFMAKALMSN